MLYASFLPSSHSLNFPLLKASVFLFYSILRCWFPCCFLGCLFICISIFVLTNYKKRMSPLSALLQESLQREREARTILRFLREQMDGVDRERRRRWSFKERLGFKVMGCCGTTWGFGSMTMSVRDEDVVEVEERVDPMNSDHNPDPGCINPAPVSSGMNLAEALAAERHFRAASGPEGGNAGIRSPGTPIRVSLMRLLEEEEEGGAEMGSDSMCCVCMGRKKGAAFIPCGHTFCRMCSRELRLNRGCCPLCNRSILEILDIF